MSELSGHGVTVDVPPGWDGRIFKRPEQGEVATSAAEGPPAAEGAKTHSITHVASVPLPADMADFGSDVVEDLGRHDALVVLFEYEPAAAATKLFEAQGLPRDLDPDAFSPNTLQRSLAGQAGLQLFFNEQGRAFSLYVVLGDYKRRHDVVPNVNDVLASVQIEPVDGSQPPAEPTTTTTGPSTTTTAPPETTTTSSTPPAGPGP